MSEYCARFGDDYFSYWVGGVKYVSINSQYYHILCVDNPEADEMAREQAAWVEEELSASATAGAVHVVVLSHITPFMGAEDEETGHFNWKRAPREWMVRLCSQPHLPGGRATIWLCGHYHASCMARTQAGTEVVTTGAAGGVINWSKPPQATATPPATKPSIARLPPLPHWLPRACPLSAHHRLPASPHRCSPRSPSSSSWSASTCRPSPATPSTRACEYAASDATGSTTASSSSTLCRPPWMRCPSPSPNPNPNPHQAPPGLEELLAMSGCTPMTAPCVP